jgi:hypothetical protein
MLSLSIIFMFAGCTKTEKIDVSQVKTYSNPEMGKVMTAINDKDYPSFSEDFDDAMKKAMTEKVFDDFASSIEKKLGKYKSYEIVKAEKVEQYINVYYKVNFSGSKNPSIFLLTFSNKDGKMLLSGIHMK